MVYDKLIHECLESYLSSGPRWYEDVEIDEVCLSELQSIHQLIFLVFLRMATYKESKVLIFNFMHNLPHCNLTPYSILT